jgi:hypothetical protein
MYTVGFQNLKVACSKLTAFQCGLHSEKVAHIKPGRGFDL